MSKKAPSPRPSRSSRAKSGTPLVETLATVHAAWLPAESSLSEYLVTLNAIIESSTDDAVRMLAEERKSLTDSREMAKKVRDAVKNPKFDEYRAARHFVPEMWRELQSKGATEGLEVAKEGFDKLMSGLEVMAGLTRPAPLRGKSRKGMEICTFRLTRLGMRRSRRLETATAAFDWQEIPDEMRPIFGPLLERCCGRLDRNSGALACSSCRATLKQLESDIAAAGAIRKGIVQRLQAQSDPEEKVERLSNT